MTTQSNDCLVIVGTQGSGVPLLARCAHILGLNLGDVPEGGDNAGDASPVNDDIALAHDILLRDLGCRFDMAGLLPRDWQDSPAARKARGTLSAIMERQMLGRGPFALADPRLCRLWPLWEPLFKDYGLDPSLLLLLRHPHDVAHSLEECHGIDLLKGHLLWLVHTSEALAFCRNHRHGLVLYEDLLAAPGQVMERLRRDLQVPFPEVSEEATSALVEYLRPLQADLRDETARREKHSLFNAYDGLYRELATGGISDSLLSGDILRSLPHQVPGIVEDCLALVAAGERDEISSDVRRRRLVLSSTTPGEALHMQVYYPPGDGSEGYREEDSEKILLAPEEWERLSLLLPAPELLRRGRLRVDPISTAGIISISAISIMDAPSGEIIWTVSKETGFHHCDVEGDCLVLESEESLHLFATGKDPRILLPPIPDLPDRPLVLELWIKVSRDLEPAAASLLLLREELRHREAAIEELKAALGKNESLWKAEREDLDRTIRRSEEDTHELRRKIGAMEGEMAEARHAIIAKDELIGDYFAELLQAERRYQKELRQLKQTHKRQQRDWRAEKKTKDGLITSYASELARAERRYAQVHHTVTRLAGLLGIDEARAFSDPASFRKTWKGSAGKAPPDEVQDTFRSCYHDQRLFRRSGPGSDRLLLADWTDRLEKELKALTGSRRWTLGGRILRILTLGLRRTGNNTAMDRLKKTVTELEARPSPGKDKKEMVRQIRQIGRDFNLLINSRRWRLGDAVLTLANRVMARRTPPMNVARIRGILSQFEYWQQQKNSSREGVRQ